MKAEERGRAIMVRALMAELEQQIEIEDLDCRAVGPLAVALADAVKRNDLLLINRGAYVINGVEIVDRQPGTGDTKTVLVHVVPDSKQALCVWCNRPYRETDSGANRKLCVSCWEHGPATEDLEV